MIKVRENTSLQLSGIEIVRDGRAFDFDTHDQRKAWKDETTVVPFIWPVGTEPGVDWAGAVRRTGTNPPPLQWSLSGDLALVPGKPCPTTPCPTGPNTSRVCFNTRHGPIESIDGTGTFRVVDSAGELPGSSFDFTPTTAWTRVCSPWFVVRSQDARLHFGTRRASAGAPNTGYLIDDVVAQRQP